MKTRTKLAIVVAVMLALLGASIQPSTAQESDRAGPLVRSAVQALNQVMPGTDAPERFTYSFLTATSDGSLGCLLLPGIDLGRMVVPYRIMLFYPGAHYTYHASGDGTILFPCDEKIPIGGPVDPGQEPYAHSPVEAVFNAYLTTFPQRGFPERFEFVFSLPTTDSSLGCPLVAAGQLATPDVPYVVTLYDGGTAYVYHVSENGMLVIPCDPKLGQ